MMYTQTKYMQSKIAASSCILAWMMGDCNTLKVAMYNYTCLLYAMIDVHAQNLIIITEQSCYSRIFDENAVSSKVQCHVSKISSDYIK